MTAGTRQDPQATIPVASHLRALTRAAHDTVDASFSRFDLVDRDDYARFLLAHASATAAVEAVLVRDATLPPWRPRLSLLLDDLAGLGLAPPRPLAFDPGDTQAARLGALYVMEGSRLGGAVLAKRVFAGAPAAFLSARHDPGEWRAFLRTLDARGVEQPPEWHDAVAAGATACFALYATASSITPVLH
jgi:heme oxygenase